jgi:hypothetical protein
MDEKRTCLQTEKGDPQICFHVIRYRGGFFISRAGSALRPSRSVASCGRRVQRTSAHGSRCEPPRAALSRFVISPHGSSTGGPSALLSIRTLQRHGRFPGQFPPVPVTREHAAKMSCSKLHRSRRGPAVIQVNQTEIHGLSAAGFEVCQ